MNILLITQYFPPEIGAAQSRLGYYARYFSKKDDRISVITANPNYPFLKVFEGRNPLVEDVEYNGVPVYRSWISEADNNGFIQRMKVYLSFSFSALFHLFKIRKGEVEIVLVETPPIFLCLSGWLYAKWHGAKLIVHVSDLWVDAAIEFGYLKNPLIKKTAKLLEHKMIALADGLIAVTETIEEKLKVFRMPVLLAPNGVDETTYYPPVVRSAPPFGRFKAVYAGTIGKIHGLFILIDCAVLIKQKGLPIDFIVIGEGSEKKEVMSYANKCGADNVVFMDGLPEEKLNAILGECNVALNILVNSSLAASTRPVKMFMYLACGLPVIAAQVGESYELFKDLEGKGVIFYKPGEVQSLLEAVSAFCREGSRYALNGNRQRILEQYTRHLSCEKIRHYLISFSKSNG